MRYLFLILTPKYYKTVKTSTARKVALLLISFIAIFTICASLILDNMANSPKKTVTTSNITYGAFIKYVESDNISAIYDYNQSDKKIKGKFKNGDLFITDNPESEDLKKYLLEHYISLEDKPFTESLYQSTISILLSIFPLVLSIAFISLLMGRMIKKQYSGNKDSKFGIIKKCDITFDNVAGNEEAKQNMMELVDFLVSPERFKKFGVVPPKGTVLFGPPGTGKTLLAKALAGTAGVPFIAVSGSDFVEKFVGVGASRIRQLFEFARKSSPCIIFIDEIDALGKRSSNDGSGSGDERDRTLNQILVEIDGFSGSEGIIVIAATNRLDMLDPALLRSGRFDRQIQVGLPDVDARLSILELHARNKPLGNDIDLKEIAKMTVYMSGADLANVMNEAGIYAVRNRHTSITMKDIDNAISKIQAGEEKRNKKNITSKDKEITAYHEAGHALIAKLLSGVTVSKVTIIPTTKGAGGYTLFLPDEKMFSTKRDLLNDIAIFLGGRASEEIVFGENEVTNGASNDLRKATQIAVDMVKNFGMSHTVGLVSFLDTNNDHPSNTNLNVVEKEVKEIIEEVYTETKELLKNNSDCLENIASLLLERETIFKKDVDNIVETTMFKRGS
ncbi:ATP-dependent zinc metalloprotease FtsH [Acetivibrio cellulolyticus]|uniref:ATP-dependent zinc metalloprotease FtsH n=1 Tax=Acetivibrio cellulolyticus TaxID=35830 RepID=UPI0001E2D449|nr:ATP-dependent zinc metalloprotease FtsH [Acetivibrio cellulolyticus]